MNVCVAGLWHLGTVTAACLASAGHTVTGLDFDEGVVRRLQAGEPPLYEPELEDVVRAGLAAGRLRFTSDAAAALAGAEVAWIAYDTPVDEDDQADVEAVVERAVRLFPHLPAGCLVLISSQVPVGTTRRLEQAYAEAHPGRPVSFAYSPENLRLGKAVRVFTQPDRVVAGVRSEADRDRLAELLRPFTDRLEWMSVESAEMTKHAINAFLAASVAFINELAVVCEAVGADAKEVERGLRTEARIGPKAYLSPGAAFAGGTLARDIAFLTQLGARHELPLPLLTGVRSSNDAHRLWTRRKLSAVLGELRGQAVAVWGLTYKPGTDTLRRSSSVELCEWLAEQGAHVRAHDPAVKSLPPDLAARLSLCLSPLEAAHGASALVVATEWPEYAAVLADDVAGQMQAAAVPADDAAARRQAPAVLDPNRFLAATLGQHPRIRYFTVGKGA